MATKKRGRKPKIAYTAAEFRHGYDGLIGLLESSEYDRKSGKPLTSEWYGWPPLEAAVTAYLDTWNPRKTNAQLLAHTACELAAGMDVDARLDSLQRVMALLGNRGRINRRRVRDALKIRKESHLLRAHRLFQILAEGVACDPAPGTGRTIRNAAERRLLEERFAILDE